MAHRRCSERGGGGGGGWTVQPSEQKSKIKTVKVSQTWLDLIRTNANEMLVKALIKYI